MICLGIESTAHTFGIGIVDDKGKILSNVVDMYRPEKGGLDPKFCRLHHEKVADDILRKSLEEAKIKLEDVDIIAYSAGPGLPPALLVGLNFIKKICTGRDCHANIIPVNHCISHVEIGKLATGFKDPVVLYVSGGNTQILAFTEGRYRVFGETQDIAVGNALDKFAREAGIPHPGGPRIEEMAKKVENMRKTGLPRSYENMRKTESPRSYNYVELPYVVKGMDVSFSGITTRAISLLKKNMRGAEESRSYKLEDLCFSLQETCFAMLTETVERAVAHTEKREVLLTGGVAANKRLQEMLRIMCEERGAKFAVVPRELAGDNGVMIAWTGILQYRHRKNLPCEYENIREADLSREYDINIFPRWRADDVEISWIK